MKNSNWRIVFWLCITMDDLGIVKRLHDRVSIVGYTDKWGVK